MERIVGDLQPGRGRCRNSQPEMIVDLSACCRREHGSGLDALFAYTLIVEDSPERSNMESMRLAPVEGVPATMPCGGCANAQRNWDRIAGKAYCPECQEAVILGVAEPLIVPAEGSTCAACNRVGTVRYLTFPLRCNAPVEMDLCPEHFR